MFPIMLGYVWTVNIYLLDLLWQILKLDGLKWPLLLPLVCFYSIYTQSESTNNKSKKKIFLNHSSWKLTQVTREEIQLDLQTSFILIRL